jgi:hypothetical protein
MIHRVVHHPKQGTLYGCREECHERTLRAARRSAAASKAGKERARGFTKEHQQAAQRSRTHASLSAAGKAGARVTMETHGFKALWKHMRQWRIENPSGPEREFADRLWEWFGVACIETKEPGNPLAFDYHREYQPFGEEDFMILDFAWPSLKAAIEINGGVHRDPRLDPHGKRAWRELQRLATLEDRGWRVLVIQDHDIDKSREQVAEFLGINTRVT